MSRQILLYALGLTLLVGCSSPEPKTTETPAPNDTMVAQKPVSVGDYQLQPPIYADSVAIVPVTYTKNIPQQEGNYITLAEAKKLGLVTITEMGDETVDTLLVENRSDRPLLLIGGDLLLGGKQDRIVAHDVIVPPGKTMKVNVYCVENGRWNGTSEHFEYNDAVVPEKVRQAAAHKGQSEVWSEVDSYNEKSGFSSGSLTVAAGLGSETVKKKLADHLPKILESLKGRKDVVGFIYVLNGKIQAADLFGNPKILQAAQNSVLKGYLADGANEVADPAAKVDLSVCGRFMNEILSDRQGRAMNGASRGRSLAFESPLAQGVEINEPAAAGGKARTEGGFVHGNYSLKR